MKLNDLIINANLIDILHDLRNQLDNGLLKDIKDGPENCTVTCIYHKDGKERRPSAGIHKETGVYHCFTCGATHSFAEFISNCFGYNDAGVYGYNWLIKNYLAVSVDDRKEIELDISRDNRADNNTDSNVFVTEQELDSYRYYHPYMYERKLTNEIIEIFDIGYDANSSCITFPIRDINGNCVCVARRSVISKFFNYPKGVEKPVYGLYEIHRLGKQPTEVIVCESMLDALVCWVYGKYAVALNGLGTDKQYKQLREMNCRKFILATDNDAAGMNARKKLKQELRDKIVTEYILPEGKKDMNDLTQEEFNNLIEVF